MSPETDRNSPTSAVPRSDTVSSGTATAPNPRRVAAGRLNRALRQGLTAEGRSKLQASARHHQPWRHATGPQSAAGRAQSAANGRRRQIGPLSRRQLRQIRQEIQHRIAELWAACPWA